MRLDPSTGIRLVVDALRADAAGPEPITLDMEFAEEGGEGATPYEVLLHAAMIGDRSLFTDQALVEESWRIVQPLLDAPPPSKHIRPAAGGLPAPTGSPPATGAGTTPGSEAEGSTERRAGADGQLASPDGVSGTVRCAGVAPTWSSSAKDLVTTALGTSRLWVTLGLGIVNEVYWPTTGEPQIRDLGFIVADDHAMVRGEAREPLRGHHAEAASAARTDRHQGELYTLTLSSCPTRCVTSC